MRTASRHAIYFLSPISRISDQDSLALSTYLIFMSSEDLSVAFWDPELASDNNTASLLNVSYDYDYNESVQKYNYFELVPTAIVYGITLIAGLIGESILR